MKYLLHLYKDWVSKQFKYLENESNIDVLVLNIVLIPNLYIDEVDILFNIEVKN
ncbi:DUF2589 domain-containing protein [Erysipelatoclostridium ramosum]|uniref:DUF2589 domain-containing protein n=1 Tax=Thomasclavelia ramosa TaxID=1547 RepID=UPI001C38C317|nr:DUF2589 domain-containing protein [Thomasclavelia ramosa]